MRLSDPRVRSTVLINAASVLEKCDEQILPAVSPLLWLQACPSHAVPWLMPCWPCCKGYPRPPDAQPDVCPAASWRRLGKQRACPGRRCLSCPLQTLCRSSPGWAHPSTPRPRSSATLRWAGADCVGSVGIEEGWETEGRQSQSRTLLPPAVATSRPRSAPPAPDVPQGADAGAVLAHRRRGRPLLPPRPRHRRRLRAVGLHGAHVQRHHQLVVSGPWAAGTLARSLAVELRLLCCCAGMLACRLPVCGSAWASRSALTPLRGGQWSEQMALPAQLASWCCQAPERVCSP